MRNLEDVIRTSLEDDAARAPELPTEWRPRETPGSQLTTSSAGSRARVMALAGVLVLVGIGGVLWATFRSQSEGEAVEAGRSARSGAFPPPGEEFSLQDDGPATSLEAPVGIPVLQELTRNVAVPGHRPLTVFTALTYRAGRGVEEVRCVAELGSAGCHSDRGDPGAHVSVTASVDNGYADFNVWVWSDVPDGVDYVTYADGGKRYWQRPVAGVVAFPDVPGDNEEVIGFTEDGVEVARAGHNGSISRGDPDGGERADISRLEFATLVTVTQDALSECLTEAGAQPVTSEILDLPAGADVRRIWDVCAAQADAALQAQMASMHVRFFDPATEQPQSEDPAFTYNTVLDEPVWR